MIIAEVVLRDASIQYDRRYSYRWPEAFVAAEPGLRVAVPFGKADKKREAYVWAIRHSRAEDEELVLKDVADLLYKEAVLTAEQIQLVEMMRLRYACTYGEAIRCMLPPGFKIKTALKDREERTVSISDENLVLSDLEEGKIKSLKQVRVLEMLLEYGEMSVREVLETVQVTEAVLKRLSQAGLLQYGKRPLDDEVEQSLEQSPLLSELEPTLEQAAALQVLSDALFYRPETDRRRLKEYLLHGVTGSGKTEIYLQLAKLVLQEDQSCLILVPEIALTPQMIERFTQRFGDEVAVMHSRLSQRERFEQWKRILAGQVRLLVGVRSAVFMPLRKLALIVLDEEHESSYQSDMSPRYHARTIARLRCRDKNCLLLLASATPSVETYARCKNSDKTRLLELVERPGLAQLPGTQIVDMRNEIREGNVSLFSKALLKAMEQCFRGGEQVILFLNRRGYAGLYLCRSCGHKAACPSCSVALTYHQPSRSKRARLICHYCGHVENPPQRCPACGEEKIQAYGLGTQQVEAALATLFPGRRVLRMDQDTTYSKYAHKEILDAFRRREAEVLLGTQMIAKGHDIPNVTLVGVLACDQLLNGNDYRANERGFQLITQAAGRAGRGELPGRVILQSFDPQQNSLIAAAKQDYLAFYQEEMLFRKALAYPPFASLAKLIVSCADSRRAEAHARHLEEVIRNALTEQANLRQVQLFAVQAAFPARLYGKSRFQILLKSQDEAALSYILRLARQVRSADEITLALILDPA